MELCGLKIRCRGWGIHKRATTQSFQRCCRYESSNPVQWWYCSLSGGLQTCSTNHDPSLHSRMTTCDQLTGATLANVSDAKVNEDRACNCSVLGGLWAANTQMPQLNIMKELAYGPQVLLFPTLTKLATSYLFLPRGTATVERSFSMLNRIACAERMQLFQIKASGPPIMHILLKVR